MCGIEAGQRDGDRTIVQRICERWWRRSPSARRSSDGASRVPNPSPRAMALLDA
jgi:hypothetical protein